MTIPPDAPPAEQLVPSGPVVVVQGQPYIPTTSGVIHLFLARTAQTTIDLPAQERRGIAVVDGAVYATSGTTIRRVDPGARVPGDLVLETNATAPLTDLVVTGDSVLALASDGQLLWLDRALTRVEAIGALPPGMTDAELHAAGDRVSATGTADLAPTTDPAAQSVAVEPVAVLIDDSGISDTLVVAGGGDVDLAVFASGEIVLTSGGRAYRVTLPE